MDDPRSASRQADAELAAAAKSGSTEAFARLYDRYAPLVRAIGYDMTGDVGQAQDVCQETFLRAYRKLGELREPDRFAPWVVTIARFVGKEYRRRRARDRHEFVGIGVDDRPAPAGSAVADEDMQALRAALAKLPEAQRLALHLFYLQDQPAEQARRIMNRSRAGFHRLLERARQGLRKRMKSAVERHP